MKNTTLQIHPDDDLIVALVDHSAGSEVKLNGNTIVLGNDVPSKHKFARTDIREGQHVRMFGITVGRAVVPIAAGEQVTTRNLVHETDRVVEAAERRPWLAPDVTHWRDRRFLGFHRSDGRVGTANYWIVIPLVFCENRNLRVMRSALTEELGYARETSYRPLARQLVRQFQAGVSAKEIRESDITVAPIASSEDHVFSNVDGIKFLSHEGGCGGLYQDAHDLCGLLAGYINHPNVAGATVLSLGCQKSQISVLESEIQRRNPNFDKPLYIFDQQTIGTEQTLLTKAIQHTVAGLVLANEQTREPAELKHICLGVECGGSDGFSGISANPSIGHCSDLIVALGGSVILSEFPELAGCEQDLTERCVSPEIAERFLTMMREYEKRAEAGGGGFDSNPSPGNIREGLITDAMKSAGAAKKGGTSPIVDVLDYPHQVSRRGLNLLCTPGGDVESTTAKAGAGATIQVFSTGLGTPTGNPISPVFKVSTNSELAARMPDIIDLDSGSVIAGLETPNQVGERLLDLVIESASGRYLTKAQQLGQDDFIPWKRCISF